MEANTLQDCLELYQNGLAVVINDGRIVNILAVEESLGEKDGR